MGERSLHLSGADGLRGLACLIVLVGHAVGMSGLGYGYLRGVPKIGVWLFFVLSAFLLTRQLMHRGFTATTFADYAVGRFLRIYPLYALVVLAHFAAGVGVTDIGRLVQALTLQEGYAHLWTIPPEFVFYIVLPPILAALLFLTRGRPALTLAAVAVLTAAHQAIWPYWQTPDSTSNLVWYLPIFLFGVAAAITHASVRIPNWLPLGLLAAAILIVLALCNPYLIEHVAGLPKGDYLKDKFLIYGAAFAGLIFLVADRSSAVTRLFDAPALARIGTWSYSIYLCHFLIAVAIRDSGGRGSWLSPFLIVGLSIAVGAGMHRLIEQPLGTLRQAIMSMLMIPRPSTGPASSHASSAMPGRQTPPR